MAKYRKKPIVVEAEQYLPTRNQGRTLPMQARYLRGHLRARGARRERGKVSEPKAIRITPEGRRECDPWDFMDALVEAAKTCKSVASLGYRLDPPATLDSDNLKGVAMALLAYRAHLATETAAIQKVRDEMLAEVHSDEAECITNEYLCGCHRLRPYIAALDVILEGRKK